LLLLRTICETQRSVYWEEKNIPFIASKWWYVYASETRAQIRPKGQTKTLQFQCTLYRSFMHQSRCILFASNRQIASVVISIRKPTEPSYQRLSRGRKSRLPSTTTVVFSLLACTCLSLALDYRTDLSLTSKFTRRNKRNVLIPNNTWYKRGSRLNLASLLSDPNYPLR